MIYLQKILLWIENQKYREELDDWKRSLAEAGITVESVAAESIDREKAEEEKCPITDACKEGELWITDSAQRVMQLSKGGHGVLVFLHEENWEQDFSGIMYACEKPWELDVDYLDKVYRRYHAIPWDILETDRCVLRESCVEDVEVFYEIYSVPEVSRYTDPLRANREQERQFIRDYIEKMYGFYGFGIWTILTKGTKEVIGRAGFSYREEYEDVEIGYLIGAKWQRQGYASEVCKAILEFGREELGFDRVQAFVRLENEVSLKLCEKLGFECVEEVELQQEKHWRLIKILKKGLGK